MSKFYEVYKMLISTDVFRKEQSPHLLTTGIGFETQKNPALVEFNYQSVYNREDRYKDVVGFYHTHPSGMNYMSKTDIETMIQWVKCLGKTLVCLIQTDTKLSGWLFHKAKDGNIEYHEVRVDTVNDVNYDLWLEPSTAFWNPADFIREGEVFFNGQAVTSEEEDEEDAEFEKMEAAIFKTEKKVDMLVDSFNDLLGRLQEFIAKTNEVKDEIERTRDRVQVQDSI
jgi:hypothetical protein